MAETHDPRYNTGNVVYDALRFLSDASFAALPRNVAQSLGEFEKNFWGMVRVYADKNIGWVDESLSAADRLRAQWAAKCQARPAAEPATPPPGPEGL